MLGGDRIIAAKSPRLRGTDACQHTGSHAGQHGDGGFARAPGVRGVLCGGAVDHVCTVHALMRMHGLRGGNYALAAPAMSHVPRTGDRGAPSAYLLRVDRRRSVEGLNVVVYWVRPWNPDIPTSFGGFALRVDSVFGGTLSRSYSTNEKNKQQRVCIISTLSFASYHSCIETCTRTRTDMNISTKHNL